MKRDVFQALSDPTRREIIQLIGRKSMTPHSLAESFPVSRQAISKHIKVLAECGVVIITKKGRERYCSIEPRSLNEVAEWVTDFRKLWEERYTNLDELLSKMQTNSKQ